MKWPRAPGAGLEVHWQASDLLLSCIQAQQHTCFRGSRSYFSKTTSTCMPWTLGTTHVAEMPDSPQPWQGRGPLSTSGFFPSSCCPAVFHVARPSPFIAISWQQETAWKFPQASQIQDNCDPWREGRWEQLGRGTQGDFNYWQCIIFLNWVLDTQVSVIFFVLFHVP